MAFLRNKKCKGNDYYVMVENRRVDGKVKQYTLETIGTWDKVMERFSSFWNQEHSQHVAATFEAFIHGAPYALYQIAEQLKIEGKCLKRWRLANLARICYTDTIID